MTEPFEAGIVLLVLVASSAFGLIVQPYLSEHHRSRETMELIRLVAAILVTFTALVLGMLTTSVKSSFVTAESGMKSVAAELTRPDEARRRNGRRSAAA